jgi:hypothetical protein
MKNNEETKELYQRIADGLIMPISQTIDISLQMERDLPQKLRNILESMRSKTRILEAMPTPETMAKADERKAQEDYLEAIIELIRKREAVLASLKKESSPTPGEAIMKHLGF